MLLTSLKQVAARTERESWFSLVAEAVAMWPLVHYVSMCTTEFYRRNSTP